MMLGPEVDPTALRSLFEQVATVGVVAEHALLPADVAALRRRLDESAPTPFFLAHRGRYELIDTPAVPELVALVVHVAQAVVSRELSVLACRGLRLRRGDYALQRDDAALRPPCDTRLFEVTVDVSDHSSGEAQIVYTRGRQPIFVAPQITGSLTLVERRPELGRYQRYLNRAVGDRVVHKVQLWLGS